LSHLESIGLIRFGDNHNLVLKHLPAKTNVNFYGTKLQIEFKPPAENQIRIGYVVLTKVGQELAPICGSVPREGFLDYVKEKWKSFGYKIE
jgi:hypothetical protein